MPGELASEERPDSRRAARSVWRTTRRLRTKAARALDLVGNRKAAVGRSYAKAVPEFVDEKLATIDLTALRDY